MMHSGAAILTTSGLISQDCSGIVKHPGFTVLFLNLKSMFFPCDRRKKPVRGFRHHHQLILYSQTHNTKNATFPLWIIEQSHTRPVPFAKSNIVTTHKVSQSCGAITRRKALGSPWRWGGSAVQLLLLSQCARAPHCTALHRLVPLLLRCFNKSQSSSWRNTATKWTTVG